MSLLRYILFFFMLWLVLLPVVFSATIKGTIFNIILEPDSNIRIEVDSDPKQRYVSRDGIYEFEVSSGNYTLHAKKFDGLEVVSQAYEHVLVPGDGTYVVDIIMSPLFDNSPTLDSIDSFILDEPLNTTDYYKIIATVLFTVIVVFIVYRAYYRLKKRNHKIPIAKVEKKPVEIPVEKQEDKASDTSHVLAPHHVPEEKAEPVVRYTVNVDVPEDEPEPKPEPLKYDTSELDAVLAWIKEQGGRTTQKDIRKQFPSSEAKVSLMLTELEHKGKIEKVKKGRGNVILLKE